MKAVKHNQYAWILAAIIGAALVFPGAAHALGGKDAMFNMMISHTGQVEEETEYRDEDSGDHNGSESGGNDSEAKAVPAPAVLPLMGVGLAGLWVSGYLTRRKRSQR